MYTYVNTYTHIYIYKYIYIYICAYTVHQYCPPPNRHQQTPRTNAYYRNALSHHSTGVPENSTFAIPNTIS